MKKYIFPILIILMVITIVIIWSNSILESKDSMAKSDSIVDKVKPIVDKDSKIPEEKLSFIIRKAGHFVEFMLLGSLLMIIKTIYKKPQIFTILFISLSVGVIDEFIQSFSNRTDSITDVLLDFAGSVTGIAFVYLIHKLNRHIKNKKINNH